MLQIENLSIIITMLLCYFFFIILSILKIITWHISLNSLEFSLFFIVRMILILEFYELITKFMNEIIMIKYYFAGWFKTSTTVGDWKNQNTINAMTLWIAVIKNTICHAASSPIEERSDETTSGPASPATAPIMFPTVLRIDE